MQNKKFDPLTGSVFAIFHALAIYAVVMFVYNLATHQQTVTAAVSKLVLTGAVWFVMGSLGVGIGFHRLLTHKGFECSVWFKRLLAFFGTMSLQGGLITWIGMHRIHHQFTDKPGDPHSPKEGFWHAHVWWMVFKSPEFPRSRLLQKTTALQQDPFLMWLDKFFYLPLLLLGLCLFVPGYWLWNLQAGLNCVLWGAVVPVVFGWNFTWAVNSFSHRFGDQPFKTTDTSTNCWWLALPTFGETWHNLHHAFERSACHGILKGQKDINFWLIKRFEKLGLVWKVYIPDPSKLIEALRDPSAKDRIREDILPAQPAT